MEEKAMPREISDVVKSIVRQFDPAKIYMFSNKRGEKGRTVGFKLCVVLNCDDRREIEHQIYLKVDSEVPFDVVAYSPSEWQALTERKGSFAQKVERTGVLLHA